MQFAFEIVDVISCLLHFYMQYIEQTCSITVHLSENTEKYCI